MKPTLKAVTGAVIVLMAPMLVSAQVDYFGKPDTVYADIAKIDNSNWTITVSYTNDESVIGLSVPLKMTAGLTRIVADSAVPSRHRYSVRNAGDDRKYRSHAQHAYPRQRAACYRLCLIGGKQADRKTCDRHNHSAS